jgi:hypothetical protein
MNELEIIYMRHIKHIIMGVAAVLSLSACSDYLDIYPENVKATDQYWKSKEEVESSLMTGYYYLRSSVEDYLIPWGELRAGCIYNRKGSNLQKFEVKPTDTKLCDWGPMYQIVNTANLVLANAAKARSNDDTYTEQEMNSHLTEAYWLRALAYFYIVRNWRDAPLITTPYETDENTYNIPQSSAADIIAQIKSDLLAAIKLGAAKEKFDTTWETKGRATIWSIYALMADVCLWNEDFDEAISYCNAILNANSTNAPHFMSTATHSSWFSMFNPGNSNESVYEVQWSHEKMDGSSYQTNRLPIYFDNANTNRLYVMSAQMLQDFNSDYTSILDNYGNLQPELAVRTMYGGYYTGTDASTYMSATEGYVWKYIGGTTISDKRTTTYYDPNFILYRVADVMLMKAEALVMRGSGQNYEDNQAAIALVNQVRERTNLQDVEISQSTDFKEMLQYVLDERLKEFLGEGKAWYDILRLGHYADRNGINFKKDFLIEYVQKYNKQASESWISSVLSNENAWYLPVSSSEMSVNGQLVQNSYYQ